MRLLVTGFGPFPRMPRNPSAGLAIAVAASPRLRLAGISAEAAVLTTAYAALAGELDPLLAAKPDVVLLIGVAGRAAKVRIEGRATSRRSTLFPDIHGDVPGRPAARASDEPARRTGVNVDAAVSNLRRRGLPARHSRDAGRYLCNAAYYLALGRRNETGRPTLFIHIPKTPRPRRRIERGRATRHPVGSRWQAALARALVDVAMDLARQARRVAAPPGFR